MPLYNHESSLGRFWISDYQEMNFRVSGRFRDKDLISGQVTSLDKTSVKAEDFFLKKKGHYYSEYDLFRITTYRQNKFLYLGDHFSVFRYFRQLLDSEQVSARTGGFIDNRNKLIVYICINLLGLISRKIADLIAVETPDILPSSNKKSTKKIEEAIERISYNSKFKTMLYSSVLALGPKGDQIWVPDVFLDDHGKQQVRIKRLMPETWFPTLNPSDLHDITEHTFAWKITTNDNTKVLRRQIYGPGFIQHKANWINDGGEIGKKLTTSEVKQYVDIEELPKDINFKRIKQNIVTHIPNLEFDEQSPFGISDYIDLKAPMDEINHRLSQLASELDKHANLSMAGPQLGLQETALGKYFEYGLESQAPHYITLPTAALSTMMDEIEQQVKYLLVLAEMSPGLVGLKEGSAPERAEALRMQNANSVVKAMRKRLYITCGIQKAFNDAMMLENEMGINNYAVTGQIRVNWKDGFPESLFEKAEYVALRTGNRPTLAVIDGIKYMDGEATDRIHGNLLEEQKESVEIPQDDINAEENPKKGE